MSKYKVGDKVLLEVEIAKVDDSDCLRPYFVEIKGTPYGIWESASRFAKTYEDGLADAWEAARKIHSVTAGGGIPTNVVRELFGNGNPHVNYTAQEAIAKLKAYEDSKEIRWGDEVKSINPESCHYKHKGIVLQVGKSTGKARVMWDTNKVERVGKSNLKKTGRNFADRLDALLSEIGNE